MSGTALVADDRLFDFPTEQKLSPQVVVVVGRIRQQEAPVVESRVSRVAALVEVRQRVVPVAAAETVSQVHPVTASSVGTGVTKAAAVAAAATAAVAVATTPAVAVGRVACRCSRQVQRRPAVVETLA
jgi:hypothetical protein